MLFNGTTEPTVALIYVLSGLYGLRVSEAVGLRWRNVDFENKVFHVVEQMPHFTPWSATVVTEMTELKTKTGGRTLPITEVVLPYFVAVRDLQSANKSTAYYDNDLVISQPNGAPEHRDRVAKRFYVHAPRLGLRKIRFHDLRHSAASNLHELSGDALTVGQILGHSTQVGNGGVSTVTAGYIDVRLKRKSEVLTQYHDAVLCP